jgi:glyoxylase-like metal-dependent hydrolase (beta-lactamase superfamily II)
MPSHRIFAFEMCHRSRDSSLFFMMMEHGKPVKIFHYFWGIQTPEEFILVDTGFTLEAAQKRAGNPTSYVKPESLLIQFGVNPKEIKKVILTHLHWDHFSNPELFENADFFVQKKDLEFYAGPLAFHPSVHRSVETQDILTLLRFNYEGRVRIVDGAAQIVPGVEVLHMGGHTPGTQLVKISTAKKDMVISGDLTPYYRNLRDHIPPGIYSDLPEVLVSHQRIEKMVPSLDFIIPGHDPEVIQKYPFDRGVVTII